MILNSPYITGSITVTGNSVFSGSIVVIGGISGSSAVSASYAVSASFAANALTASYAANVPLTSSFAISASQAQNAVSSSFATNAVTATSASQAQNAVSSSFASTATSASFASTSISSSFAPNAISASQAQDAISSSFALTATSASQAQNAVSSSFATNAANADLLDGKNSTEFAITGSNIFTGIQYITDVTNPNGFEASASIYTDGGLRVTKDTYVSGTIYVNNLTVFGTQSINYITSSQLNIGTNIISVNTDTPSVRFGGLAVYDSGSTGLTGSLLWDSEDNHWIYSNPSGSSYDGGMMISGPRNSSGLGNEQGTLNNVIVKGQGGDHVTSSQIIDDGTTVRIPGNLQVTGSIYTSALTGSLNGSNLVAASVANDRLTNSTISSIALGSNLATLTIGTGLSGTSYNGSTAVTIANSGVTSIVAGTGISINQGTGAVTVTNTITNNNQLTNGAGYITSAALSNYVTLDGTQTITGLKTINNNLLFANSGTTKRGIQGTVGTNDMWFVGGGATAENAGFLEISTGDDGQTAGSSEPIYVRQYGPGDPLTGTLVRTATLLDTSGNTSFPGTVTAPTFSGALSGNASTASTATTLTTNATISGLNFGGVLALTASGASTGNSTGARLSESYGPIWNLTNSATWHHQVINGSYLCGISAGGGNYGGGNYYGTGDVTAYYSDMRLKTKVSNITNAIEKVKSLEGFTYIENELARSFGYTNTKEQSGISAQQVQAVLPEAVSLAPFDMQGIPETGDIVSKSGENYLTVKYERLVPLLIEAIKEQQSQIEELKTIINGLTK